MKSHITIVEKKTNKSKRFPIVNGLYTELDNYTKNMKDNVSLEKIGTHTLRKTFGYHHYKQFKDLAILQQ